MGLTPAQRIRLRALVDRQVLAALERLARRGVRAPSAREVQSEARSPTTSQVRRSLERLELRLHVARVDGPVARWRLIAGPGKDRR